MDSNKPKSEPSATRYVVDHAELKRRFTYHAPAGDQPARYNELRDKALDLAIDINERVPDCRERALALTHLEQAIMFANAGIARREA